MIDGGGSGDLLVAITYGGSKLARPATVCDKRAPLHKNMNDHATRLLEVTFIIEGPVSIIERSVSIKQRFVNCKRLEKCCNIIRA